MKTKQDRRIDSRNAGKSLAVCPEPYWVILEKGRALGSADDFADADGKLGKRIM